jgi:hypothetical protein
MLCHTQVFEWHKWFIEGLEEMEDNECQGHFLTSKTEEIVQKTGEIVRKDRSLSI